MKIGTMMLTAGVVALGLATWTPSKAQGPLYDRVNVSLPYSVTIGERTLQPGDYVIQQLRDQGGGSRVLLIYSDNGMKFETSAMTIPALDNRTPEDTKVVLHHFGNDYYFDKIWIQGKDYGYEFPLPDAVKARERERAQPLSVAANYSTVQQTESTSTTTSTTAASAAAAPTTASAATQPQTPASSATTQSTTLGQHADANQSQTPTTSGSTQTAQAPATTQSQTTMQPSTTQSQTTMQPSTTTGRTTMSAADRGMNDASGSADRAMPDTAAGWLMMLLGGGALSGAGLMLRRKQ